MPSTCARLELERSDVLIARLWPLVDREDPDAAVLDRLLRVMDYRALLLASTHHDVKQWSWVSGPWARGRPGR